VAQQRVKMGIGDGILRLLRVQQMYSMGIHKMPAHLLVERQMLIDALNQYELDLGFDCNEDGVPDTIEIFEQSASTSCCRILPRDWKRRPTKTGSRAGQPRKTVRSR
jgi:hypothetical protein